MMRIIHGHLLVPPDLRGGAIAIGTFDGVHRGHRVLIDTAKVAAERSGRVSGVLAFEPHPREYFQPTEAPFRLTSLPRKLELFTTLGLDVAFVEPFDAALAKMPAREFVKRVLVDGLGITHAVVGYDFYFGHKRGGNPELLVDLGREFGFGVSVMPPVAEHGEVFSSSAVRVHLAQGDVAGATRLLGAPWRVSGEIVGGAKRGTGLGYPTANVPMPKGTALAHGIYAVRAEIDGTWHAAAAYLGTRPTFDGGMPVLEVFLLNFDGDIYGQDMSVDFIAFIRADRKFDTADALVAQMDRDVAAVRDALEAAPT